MIRCICHLPSLSFLVLAGCGFSFCQDELTGLDESAPRAVIANWCQSGSALDQLVISAQRSDASCRAVDLNDPGVIADVPCAERFDVAAFSNPGLTPVAHSPNYEFIVAFKHSDPAGGDAQGSLVVVHRSGQQRGEIRFREPAQVFEPIGVTSDGAHVLGRQYGTTPAVLDLLIVRVSDATVVDRHAIALGGEHSLAVAFATVDLQFVVYEARQFVSTDFTSPGAKPAIRLWNRRLGADTQLN